MDKEIVDSLWADRMAVRDVLREYEVDYDEVDDLVQEVYARALESSYSGESEPLTWLCGIAKHVGVDHVRKMRADKRAREVLDVHLPDEELSGAAYYDRTDLSTHAAEASAAQEPSLLVEADRLLDTLPPIMADVLRLRYEGYSAREIADTLDISVGYVANLTSAARNLLQECEDSQFNTTNRVRERDGEPLARAARLSQSDVERTQRKRFGRMDSAFAKRSIRFAMPDASLNEWEEAYE